MKSELVAVGTHDIVACIPDIISSLHCSANLISVTMEVQHADRIHMVICMMQLQAQISQTVLYYFLVFHYMKTFFFNKIIIHA